MKNVYTVNIMKNVYTVNGMKKMFTQLTVKATFESYDSLFSSENAFATSHGTTLELYLF